MKKTAIALLCVGLLMLSLGIFLSARTALFIHRAISTRGKVVEIQSVQSTQQTGRKAHRTKAMTTFRPVFEFKDANGMLHRVAESFSSKPALFRSGDSVAVIYEPADPQNARINALRILWTGPALVTGAGAVMTLIGYCLRRMARRRANQL